MRNQRTANMTMIGLMTAVLCILGPLAVAIPVSPVPISLTTFAIFLTVILLGVRRGTLVYLVYLFIGFVGVPVFSGFTGGPAKLVGPTGGYLIGFIFMAAIAGLFIDRFQGKIGWAVLGMALGSVVTYLLGTLWLAYVAGLSFTGALFAGVIPFLPGDFVKILLACLIGFPVKKQLRASGILK